MSQLHCHSHFTVTPALFSRLTSIATSLPFPPHCDLTSLQLPLPCHSRESGNLYDSSNKIIIQITPLRIIPFDKLYFPAASPLLDSFFPSDSTQDVCGFFKIHQFVSSVLFSKPFNLVIFVFVNPSNEVIGNTSVESTVPCIGQDVNVI